jgi:hypothetical protein
MSRQLLVGTVLGLTILGAGQFADGATIYWTNWTTPSYGVPGSASGTITFPTDIIGVTYSGEVVNRSDMGDWNFPGTYSKPPIVDNTPTPAGVSIMLVGNNDLLDTITFSTPLVNPIMAIQSLGNSGDPAEYDFTSPFVLLQQGSGHWDGGSLSQIGNTLYGSEGNGIIQFQGVYSSISWTVPDGEDYNMFTIGAEAVPAPAALLLAGIGTGLAACLRRRKAL